MSTPIRVGLIGLGTVGQGVVRVLKRNSDEIARRVGRPIVVTHASARDLTRKRDCDLNGVTVVNDPMSIARDANVDVVVEVIGGLSPARELILAAIARDKPVVTANKALLAEDGNRIFDAARERGVMLAFEAAVAGGIPIIKVLREGMAANRIESLAGIINGTCNYILTEMSEKGMAFADALAEAQRLGYAEADPRFDVEGIDAAHKLTILAACAFGMPLSYEKVAVEGITALLPQDLQLARELGYRVKSLALAKRGARGVELRVHPTLIPEDRLLAKVDGVLNSVLVRGDAAGETGYYGRGAGAEATASAVIADLVDVARLLEAESRHHVAHQAFQPQAVQELPVVPILEIESAYYLRLQVADVPGVLRAITSILAELNISIEAILQKEPRGGEDATLAIITSTIREALFNEAVNRIQGLSFVRPGLSKIRVEHFDK